MTVATALASTPIVVKPAGQPTLKWQAIPWAKYYLEHPQVIKFEGVYHMYFHAVSLAHIAYEICHAVALSALGPWAADALPCLTLGAPGAWDDNYVATPYVLQDGATFRMYYGGNGPGGIQTGMATSSSPYGPWVKSPANPFVGPQQWVGTVLKVGATYYLLGGAELQQVAWTAPGPTGPWAGPFYPFGPGTVGSWNEQGSMGESGIVLVNGVYHMFFGGFNDVVPPIRPFAIGYAVSDDLVTWHEYGGGAPSNSNPIIPRGAAGTYDSLRMSEISVYYESGTFYVYYTSTGPGPLPNQDEQASVAMVRFIRN